MPAYVDIALPVPLDQLFVYSLPETLRHRVKPGSRLVVPFGSRKLTGIAVRVHDEQPESAVREAWKLIDEQPVIEQHLIELGRWMASYYCAPIGEALRAMAPLSGEIHASKVWSLTDAGRDTSRQLSLVLNDADPAVQLMRMLESRSLSGSYLAKKIPDAVRILKSLQKKGLTDVEDMVSSRDPFRAASERLRITASQTRPEGTKLKKSERELLSFLELHPGAHNLKDLDGTVKGASESARALARRGFVALEVEASAMPSYPFKAPPVLNPHQQSAFEAIEAAVRSKQFAAFLLQGVTGSGKTEVYLRSIEATLAAGRNALLLVPEIALTPAVAGQFYHRFGDRVAILHSA
ncbi:MAG: DEAD/DEAH box helicase family protein, partial [Bryobacteraceae bacterium]|nr:DEAD/DEAH box helicase family protein [Bryobacteraceae bacterium]